MMTSKLFAFAALVFLLAGCSGESQFSQDGSCEEDGDCPSGFSCENGLCEGASSATTDGGTGSIGDGGATVNAAGMSATPGANVEVETDDCKGRRCDLRPGSSVTFRAMPVGGYRFTGWTGEGCPMSSAWEIVVEDVKVDTVCTANYVKLVRVSGGSSVGNVDITASTKAEPAACDGPSCVVDEGSIVLISASELSGYRFAGFIEPECTDIEGLTVFVKAGGNDITCTASYARTFEVAATSIGVAAAISVHSDTAFAKCTAGLCVIDEQGEVRLTAPVLDGYRFAGWSGDTACVGSATVLDIMPVTGNVSCSANYVARFTATGLAAGSPTNPAPLATSSADFAQCTAGVCEVDEGSDVVLSARTVPGYRLTGFTGAGCAGVSGTAVALTDVAANIECTAQYVQGISIAGNVVGGSGQVIASSNSPGKSCAAGGCVVDAGGNVTLTAPSLGGFRFTGWTGDAGCSGTTQTITLSKVTVSATCSANFVARHNVSFPDPLGGSILVSNVPPTGTCNATTCTVDNGTSLRLTAAPDNTSTHRFVSWSGCSTSTNPVLDLTVTGNATCTAIFVQRWKIDFPDPAVGSITPSNYAPTSVCDADSCDVDDGSSLRLTAAADNANTHRFARWSGCSTSTNPVLPLATITANANCTAVFDRLRTVTFSGAPVGGTVTSSPAAVCIGTGDNNCVATVIEGTNVDLSAANSAGYRFGEWSCTDADITTVNVLDLNAISADLTCNASFRQVQRFTITLTRSPSIGPASIVTPSTGNPQCSVSGDTSSCIVDSGTSVQLSGSSTNSTIFKGFSGDGACASGSVVVTSNVACYADFYGLWSRSYATAFRGPGASRYDGLPRVEALPNDGGTISTVDSAAYPTANEYAGWFAPLDEHLGTAQGDQAHVVRDVTGASFQTLGFGLVRSGNRGLAMIGSKINNGIHSPLLTLFDGSDAAYRSQEYKGSDSNDYLTQIIWRQDRYVAAGFYQTPASTHVAAFTTSGKPIFHRSIGLAISQCKNEIYPTRGQALAATTDGIAVLSRVELTGNRSVYAILLSVLAPDGTTLREVTITDADDRGPRDLDPKGIFVTKDDEIVIVGTKRELPDATSAQNAFVMFLKRDLNIAWQLEIGVSGAEDSLWDVIEAADNSGEFVLAGATSAVKENGMDGWIVRLDRNANIRGQYSYGSALSEMLLDVKSVPTGGYVLSGYRYDPNLRIRTYSTWVTRVADDLKIAFNASSGMSLRAPNTTNFPMTTTRVTATSNQCFYNVPMQAGEASLTPVGADPNLAEVGYAP